MAQALELRAHTTYFRALIAGVGVEETRRFVARHALQMRERYSGTLNRPVDVRD
jgi:hypothetical protein